ncbi:DNA recombination protein RmuC [Oryzisolibacter propanilivorax]|uniref:DNA recombination protein RmuC n=1 Tax=Oryzisolibacter propanilivorax TaxID=1527607 RepID=A0A1G9P1M6_9BURK|nr:DNA recombination protein RmuC [Oryzisolibacter propanilivorax]SDL92708.1 DNA recombination protein RmuC [Oryzisolibacter propanilivorax]
MDMFAVLALLVLIVLLLGALLLRAPRLQLPDAWLQQLKSVEAAVQATQLAVARNDGALAAMDQQLRGFTQTTQALLDERLAQAAAESRSSRGELQTAFAALQSRLEQQLGQSRADAAAGRKELSDALAAFRAELAQTTQALTDGSTRSREAIADSTQAFGQRIQERFDALGLSTQGTLQALKGDIHTQLSAMAEALKDQLAGNTRQLAELAQGSQHNADALRGALNERLAAIQSDNAARLEEMRRTVDEKLQSTLEQRLGESFKLVSDRLEQVHKGLGEMQTLAGSVGDLKRVMTNVKSRGTWGELQLGMIIDNVLTPEQYAKNVKTMPGSEDLVEFAIRLPGRNDEHPVWLPIDSKYPVEHYQRLLDAHDAADKALMLSAGNAFETSIRLEARKISAKYVSPPHTTDFAVLYLPTEGLFAEVMRRPGLVEAVQNECRVMITGPANLAAMLNSLQMGFKTLAIEKRSSEVWGVLGQVKTEFAKFGEVVEATRKSIDAAAKKFEQVGVRTRAIQRRLRDVQELPAPEQAAAASAVLNQALAQGEIDLAPEADPETQDA